MEVTATLRKLRMAPQKVRLVINEVRGLSVEKAEVALSLTKKAAAVPVLKLIQSATANALHNHKLQKDQLYIKTIQVDDGVTLHRWMPRAFGRATPIRKRSSHIHVVLDVKPESKEAARKKAEAKKVTDAKAEKTDVKPAKEVVDEKATAKKTETVTKPSKSDETTK